MKDLVRLFEIERGGGGQRETEGERWGEERTNRHFYHAKKN